MSAIAAVPVDAPQPDFHHLKFVSSATPLMREVHDILGDQPGMAHRRGAAFGAASPLGVIVHHFLDGTVALEEDDGYARVMIGMLHPKGSGVAGKHWRWAVAGYTPEVDNLAAILLACMMKDITKKQAYKLAEGNPHKNTLDTFFNNMRAAIGPR